MDIVEIEKEIERTQKESVYKDAIDEFSTNAITTFISLFTPVGLLATLSTPLIGPAKRILFNHFSETNIISEKVRLTVAYSQAQKQYEKRIDRGDNLRNDGFLKGVPSGQRLICEISEDFILKSKKTIQLKKINFLSNVYTNIFFINGFEQDEFHQICELFDRISFRQLVILHLAATKTNQMYDFSGVTLRNFDYNEFNSGAIQDPPAELISLLNEVFDLYQKGLIGFKDDRSNEFSIVGNPFGIVPNDLVLNGQGKRIHQVCNLNELSNSDEYDQIVRVLSKGMDYQS